MAKKDEKEINEEKSDKIEKVEEKVEKKVEAAEKKIEAAGGRENIIGDISKPDVKDPDFDFKAWAKALDEKLDRYFSGKISSEKPDDKTSEPPPPPKKVAWYDKELI